MMEEEKNDHTDTDINAIMAQFSNIRKRYFEDRKRLLESEGVLATQREQLRLSREAEERERRKAGEFQRSLKQQQDIIDNFLGVSEQNLELTREIEQLRKEKEELLDKMKADRESWQQRIESLKLFHKKELDDLKAFAERKARDARSDLDMYRAEYDMKRKEMETRFQALQKEKRSELDITTQICDGKIQNMEEQITSMLYNQERETKENAAQLAIYKQKVVDLERKLMQVEIDARRNNNNKASSYGVGTPTTAATATHGGYRYNNNSIVAPPPPTILKKTTAYAAAENPRGRQMTTPTGGGNAWRGGGSTSVVRGGGGGKGRSNNIQPLEFVEESDNATTKKVTFGGPKKRKLYNPNDDDLV